ncbi:MAG: TonB-dependent receptor, partial [candidate division KSB1 bacterium]|nr:TonB-dependent receptor [candidate division KSB1 bacterium]
YLNRAGEQQGYWSLHGNTDLKPIGSKAWEINYRRVASPQSMYSFSFFHRRYDNLLDTSPFLVSNSATVANSGNALRYENRASARMSGFEVAFKHDFGKGFNGAFYYTYLKTAGTASWPESGLLAQARGQQEEETAMRSALAWDQRHTFTANLGYMSRSGFLVNLLAKIYGSAIATDWLTNDQQGLLARNELDFKISFPVQLGNKLRVGP